LSLEGKVGQIGRSPSEVDKEEFCSFGCGDLDETKFKGDDGRVEFLDSWSRKVCRLWKLFAR
jgi:hypothetical protein